MKKWEIIIIFRYYYYKIKYAIYSLLKILFINLILFLEYINNKFDKNV